jgi:hypothetical protein
LVALGCSPLATAATSAYAVLITATAGLAQVCSLVRSNLSLGMFEFIAFVPHLSPMLQVLILGLLPVDYGLLFAAVGVVATFIGQTAVDYLVIAFRLAFS